MIISHRHVIVFLFLFFSCVVSAQNTIDKQKQNEKLYLELKQDIDNIKNTKIDHLIEDYKITNDRLNSQITYLGLIATIFGLILALAGIFIGFESIRSQKRREEAIKTLEGAKAYVDSKKMDFQQAVDSKLSEVESEYKKLLSFMKEQLTEDINKQSIYVKEVVERKSQEIENLTVDDGSNKTLEHLLKRVEFFEKIGIPDDPDILFSKSKLLIEQDMKEDAILLLNKLISIKPDHEDAHWKLGQQYYKLKQFDKSIEHYQRALKISPNKTSTLNNIGVNYNNLGKSYEALTYFQKAIDILPTKALYYSNKGEALISLKSIADGISAYKKAIELSPQEDSYYRTLLNIYQTHEYIPEALNLFDDAIKNSIDNKNYFIYQKVEYLYKIKKYDEAINILSEFINQNYNSDECHILYSNIKRSQGKIEEALNAIEKSIALNPKNDKLIFEKVKILYQIDIKQAKDYVLKIKSDNLPEDLFSKIGRYFADNNDLIFSRECYLFCNSILKESITNNDAGSILNYFESLLIIGDYNKADEFLKAREQYITSVEEKHILYYLLIAKNILINGSFSITESIKTFNQFIKSYKSMTKVDWIFDDINNFIKPKMKQGEYEKLIFLSEILNKKFTESELNDRIILLS